MSESLRSRLVHALLSLLMAVGLLIPLLGILDSSLPSPVIIPWIVLIIVLFELSSLKRAVGVGGNSGESYLKACEDRTVRTGA